jgi:hypothetical protein
MNPDLHIVDAVDRLHVSSSARSDTPRAVQHLPSYQLRLQGGQKQRQRKPGLYLLMLSGGGDPVAFKEPHYPVPSRSLRRFIDSIEDSGFRRRR